MRTEIIRITPTRAKQMLAQTHPNQRPVSNTAVVKYAEDMSSGQWLHGSSIIIGPSGLLLDGRHRLLAVVKSGVTLEFVLVYVDSDDVAHGIDIGRTRSVRDILAFDAVKVDTSVVGAVALEHTAWTHLGTISKMERARLVKATPQDAIDLLTKWRRAEIRGTAPVLSVARATYRLWPVHTISFFEGLLRNTGEYKSKRWRLLQVMSAHILNTAKQTSGFASSYELAYRTAQTWHRIAVEGKDAEKLLPYRENGSVASFLTTPPLPWDQDPMGWNQRAS